MVRSKVIAIDGPAAAGKSTIAQKVAQMLGYVYIDTGAMYRAVTLKALNQSIYVEDEETIAKMLQNTTIRLTNDKKVFLDIPFFIICCFSTFLSKTNCKYRFVLLNLGSSFFILYNNISALRLRIVA